MVVTVARVLALRRWSYAVGRSSSIGQTGRVPVTGKDRSKMTAEPLSARRNVDHETLWRAMQRMLDRASTAFESGEAVLEDCLDNLVDVLGADRGMLLFSNADDMPHVAHARGTLSALEREEIGKTIVRRALDSDQCVRWDPSPEHANGLESMAHLGIVASLAAPVPSGSAEARGVLYVDFRDPQKYVEDAHVAFFMAGAVLFSAMLRQHRQWEAQLADRDIRRSSSPPPRTYPPGEIPTWQQLQGERARLEELEKEVIRSALDRNGGVVAHAGRELGIARTTLASRLTALGIARR